MRNRVANMPPECNGDRGATMRREAGGGQREGERGGMSDLRGQRRPGTRTRPQKTAPSTLLPAFSPGARARAAALGDMNRPTNPGGSACQAARAGRGAREGGTRCGRGLNARKMGPESAGPALVPTAPRCHRVPNRWLQRRCRMRAAVGWPGALGGGGEPRQLPSSPARHARALIDAKTEGGWCPGLQPAIVAPAPRSGSGRAS